MAYEDIRICRCHTLPWNSTFQVPQELANYLEYRRFDCSFAIPGACEAFFLLVLRQNCGLFTKTMQRIINELV